MSNWLVVRSVDDLSTVLPQINRMLMSGWSKLDDSTTLQLQGVWIDPLLATRLPARLISDGDDCDSKQFDIHQAIGLSGVWQLLRLQTLDTTSRVAPGHVLTALIRESVHSTSANHPQVIPVLTAATDWDARCDDINHLVAIAQANNVEVPAVWYQDLESGLCQQADKAQVH